MATLLFVYNANGGIASALIDTGRRIFRPGEYPCALCMVTYGPFGMKAQWKKFTDDLPYDTSFLHKDELPEKLQSANLAFPCVLLVSPESTVTLINADEFKSIRSLSTLQIMLARKLKAQPAVTS